MFDISVPVRVQGTVVSYQPIAPHAMIELEARSEEGGLQRWIVEGPFPGRLNRIVSFLELEDGADFLRTGDQIEVCGFSLKDEFSSRRPSPFMHGQIIVMPDGHMQSWGPYGKIENCVRPQDETGPWVEFLNADPLARDLWCGGLSAYSRQFATVPPEALVERISGLIDNPCK
jgi:hypothetical protein